MTIKQAIEQLQTMNPDAKLGSFNPCVSETIWVAGFERDGEDFVQVFFNDGETEDKFAPL